VSWVLSAYAIVFAAVLVPAGRLADQYGRKRTLLTGVALFTIASAMASLAPTLDVLIAARAVQATGAAMIVSTSLGLLYPSFPERQHTLVVGIWAGVAGIAGSAGPPVGGLLVTAGWRWIFLINLPIGLATIAAGIVVLPEVRQAAAARLPDPASAISLLLAVSLLVLATVEGPGWGWGSGRTISLFAAATAMAVVTVQRSLRAAAPVIEKELFRSRQFSPDTVALLLYFTGFSIFLLGGALFMQDVWHFSALRAGVGIAPAPVASVGFALNAGPIQGALRTDDAGRGRHDRDGRGCGVLAHHGQRFAFLLERDVSRARSHGRVWRPVPGPNVRCRRNASARACHHRQRRPEHDPPDWQRHRRRATGRANGDA
jgi:MFS family permease